jgi:hypothetical protein
MWHDKDPPCSKALIAEHLGLNLQPFTGNGDVSIWVKDFQARHMKCKIINPSIKKNEQVH